MSDVTQNPKKRSFLKIATGVMVGIGACGVAWPLIRQMSPSADIERPLEIEFLGLKEGESMMIDWEGSPLVLRHRTIAEIAKTRAVEVDSLRDRLARNGALAETAPATVENRSFGPDGRYVLMFPICTHLGCKVNERGFEVKGERFEGGFVCPCHSAMFDSLGRVYGGPAMTNLPIPIFRIRENRLQVFRS
jgi:ubiquinol-cytochrome c reductase iron-sulfur subunit